MGELASEFLRGLRDATHVGNDKTSVTAPAFYPANADLTKDDCRRSSINFYENDDALILLQNDKKNSEFGIAKLLTSKFKKLQEVYEIEESWCLEKDPLMNRTPPNPYHGNIVYKSNLSYDKMKTLAGALAAAAKLI
ncbi:hypothetical protein [Leptospira stimsonii]|nr:hypothetical protein [Leptospira stimsonii]